MGRKCVLRLMLILALVLSSNSTSAMGQPEGAGQGVKQKLVVGVISTPPYSIQDDDGTWSGITVDLWKEIAGIIGVDYVFKKEENLKSLLKELKDGSLDVVATGVSITKEREKEFDFSDPYLAAIEAVAVNA